MSRMPSASSPFDLASWRSAHMVYLLFAAGIALSPLGDFLSVRGNSGSNGGDARYSLILRGAVIAGLIVAMLLSGRVRSSNWRSAFLAALAVVVSSVAYAAGAMSGKEYIEQTIFVLKVFSFFVYFAALTGLTDRQLARLEPLVRMALLVYSAAIVVGAVLSIDMFRRKSGFLSGRGDVLHAESLRVVWHRHARGHVRGPPRDRLESGRFPGSR